MTPEQQRIEIARACGWKAFQHSSGTVSYLYGWKTDDENEQASKVPDYLADLNAMAEAEKMLTPEQLRGPYRDNLVEASRSPHAPIWCATAAQRAEAFLRTLNLWTDNQPIP